MYIPLSSDFYLFHFIFRYYRVEAEADPSDFNVFTYHDDAVTYRFVGAASKTLGKVL